MSLLSIHSFAALKVARYEIRLRALESAQLPAFAGSALRGAFGHALKRAVCVMPHRDCQRCLVVSRCIYPTTFEPEFPAHFTRWQKELNAPTPFVLDPPVHRQRVGTEPRAATTGSETADRRQPKWEQHRLLNAGDEITFGLTLLGQAIDHLPFIVLAIHEMTQRGIGSGVSSPTVKEDSSANPDAVADARSWPKRPQFALAEVAVIDANNQRRTIYTESSQRLESPAEASSNLGQLIAARLPAVQPGQSDQSLRLQFLTPVRIKVEGDLQPRAGFDLIVRNLLRRVSMLTALYGQSELALDYPAIIARAAEIQTVESQLRWWDVPRYSNRQHTKMKMGGFVGSALYQGAALAEFLPLLVAGEILRLGKGTSFGLGKFGVETLTG